METGDAELDCKIKEWLEWDKNERTHEEIQHLVKEKNVSELRRLLCSRMAFGTAGLRAKMGAGNSQMNDLTIIQTTQGFVRYMEKICPHLKERGVVIGYDARHNSRRWAEIVSTVLINRGVKVYLYRQICPTPFVPYGVLHFGCDWGIMITASHNPKCDNGYKVYYNNGAQIIPPHDKGIAASILENLEPWATSWDNSIIKDHPNVTDPFDDVMKCYYRDMMPLCYRGKNKNASSPIRFVYSAMHGVGYTFIQEAFKAFGFSPVIPVALQVEPDPEFTTVKFPNPEEGKSALNLSIETADAEGCRIILANDPDADRLAIAEKQTSGRWHVLSGNEIGTLLGHHLWRQHLASQPEAGSDVYCLASTVSSKILRTIANKEGFSFIETLTGFKWMGNVSDKLIQEGKTVIFAFEEAIGFMCGSVVLDKDGVSAAVVAAEMISELYEQNLTLSQQLENIYSKYGYHVSNNSYFLCYEPEVVTSMFTRLRNWSGPDTYPPSCGPYPIKYIRDLTTGYDNNQPDNKAVLPVSKSSHMITFTLENGCEITIRTSGTEPKIKYYTEFISDPSTGMDRETVSAELGKVVAAMIENFFEPEKNKLTARPT